MSGPVFQEYVAAEVSVNEAGDLVFFCSDPKPDRANDRIETKGIRLDNYLKNPVLLWCHDKGEPAIGITKAWRDDRGLWMSPTFSKVNPLGKQIGEQVKAGEIRAVSVGVIPIEAKENELGGIDIAECELVEISICNVGMHPDALRTKSMDNELGKQLLEAVTALTAKVDALKPAEKPAEKAAETKPEEKPADGEKPAEGAAPSASETGEKPSDEDKDDVTKTLSEWLTK